MRESKKSPENFTGTDLYKYWTTKFKAHRGTTYQPAVSIRYDQHLFKGATERYDNYVILLGISKAIINNVSTVRYFIGDIESYCSETDYPDIEYHVKTSGDAKRRQGLAELRILEAQWFPTASDNRRKIQLVADLRDWVEDI